MTSELDVSQATSITESETRTVSDYAVKDVDDMPAFEIPMTLTSQVHDRPQKYSAEA
jgi:hypothetical protein